MTVFNFCLRTVLFVLLILLAPVARLLAYNWDYFEISLYEAVGTAVLLSVVLAFIFLPVSFFKTGRSWGKTVLSASLVLVTASVYVIPIDLPAIDGGDALSFLLRQEVFWVLFAVLSFSLLYGLAIFFAGSLAHRVSKVLETLGFVAAVYVMLFASYAFLQAPVYFGKTGAAVEKYSLPLSAKENIFIIGFDQVQGSLMEGLLRTDEDLAAVYDGFVFYSDAASTYPNTNYSLSSIVLGRPVDNQSESYKEVSSSSSSLFMKVKNKGYSTFTARYNSTESAACLTCPDSNDNVRFNYNKIYELFRHAVNLAVGVDVRPLMQSLSVTFLELPAHLHEHAWKLDLQHFSSLLENAQLKNSKPTFYFMHFLGTHQPFTYDSTCVVYSENSLSELQNPQGGLDSARCITNLLNQFFETLKTLGIYDSSTIIIYSDHGYEANINKFASGEKYKAYFGQGADVLGDIRNIKPVGSYNPVLIYKSKNSSGKIIFNSDPVSLIDIASTVCADAGCVGEWQGQHLLNPAHDKNRERDFWMYVGGQDVRAEDGSNKLHAGLDKFWERRSFSGSLYPNLAIAMGVSRSEINKELNVAQFVKFNGQGNSATYINTGWSGQEATHRWTEGPKAGLQIRLQDTVHQDLVLKMNTNGYLGGGLSHQKVSVSANGVKIADWELAGPAWHEALIPAGLVDEDGLVNLAFDISDPRAPCDYSDSTDCRQLGMAVRELVIDYVH